MNELKSISQIAKDLGVSRQAVYQKIKNNSELSSDLSKFTVKKNNATLYTLQAQKMISLAFSNGVTANCKRTIDSKQMSIDNRLIDSLTDQLKVKDKQIEELTAALKSSQEQQSLLTQALTAAQALHAGTIQERLTEHPDVPDIDNNITTTTEVAPNVEDLVQQKNKKRKGFFLRIFKR